MSLANGQEKPRIDVNSLPRTRSGRIVIPRLEFWRQERLISLSDMTVLISVNSNDGRSVHNSTILNETSNKPPTNEPIVILKKCDVRQEGKRTKRAKLDVEDAENSKYLSTICSTKETLKRDNVEPVVSKALRSRLVCDNGRERKSVSRKTAAKKGAESIDLVIKGSDSLSASRLDCRYTGRRLVDTRTQPTGSTVFKQVFDTIPEELKCSEKTLACNKLRQRKRLKRTSSSHSTDRKTNTYPKEKGDTDEIPQTEKETTTLSKRNTDYKVTAKPGTLLFKSQIRDLLTLNSQCDEDEDNFTNSTPYMNKKRFKLQGMRLDDGDDETEYDIQTPRSCVPILNQVSAKRTPALYRSTVTPQSQSSKVDRKLVDRYIRNRKRKLRGKGNPSRMISSIYGTPHQPTKTKIDSSCFRLLTSHLKSVQDNKDDDDDDDEDDKRDYYFSDDDSE